MTDVAAPVKLTPARRRALLVLFDRHLKSRTGRTSNVTDVDEGLVYWQSGNWLVEHGLAKMIDGTGWPSNTYLRITPAGIQEVTGGAKDLAALDELSAMRAAKRNGAR